MTYNYKEGILVPFVQKFYKQMIVVVAALFIASMAAMTFNANAAPKSNPVSGPGNVSVGVDATEWSSSTLPGNGNVPIGGSGQVNGEFTTAERNGIQIGLRAQDRFTGTLEASSSSNGKIGVYESEASLLGNTSTASEWNYDWHVDLRGAKGAYAGTTLEDYTLELETDIANSIFGFTTPVDLTFNGFVPADTVLYQSSQNPTFGNDDFDSSDVRTYTFRLVLTPKTFNGPQLAVAIQVNVVDNN